MTDRAQSRCRRPRRGTTTGRILWWGPSRSPPSRAAEWRDAAIDKPLPGSPEWCKDHGISEQVYSERGYTPYERDDAAVIDEMFAGCAPNQRAWARNMAKEQPGLVMPAYRVPGFDLCRIPPQLRPDRAIQKPPRVQWHPNPEHDIEAQLGIDVVLHHNGKEYPVHSIPAYAMRAHILKAHGREMAEAMGYVTPNDRYRLCADPECREDLMRILAERNYNSPHLDPDEAKYLLTITAKVPLAHDHDDYYGSPKRRAEHVAKYHGGTDVRGRHVHDGERYSIKMVDDDDPRHNPGKRLDILPLAWRMLAKAEFLVFVLEGKIKADAALSHIIEHGLPGSALNVPSVWQWDAAELEVVFGRLAARRKPPAIVIVVDSDADVNDSVMTAGLLLRQRMNDFDLRACLAAPRPDDRAETDVPPGRTRFEKVGLDDHLGELGRNLLDIDVINFDVPEESFAAWAERHREFRPNGKHRIHLQGWESDVRAMRGLIQLAGPSGRTTASLRAVGRFIGKRDPQAPHLRSAERETRAKDIERAVKRLIMSGDVRADGSVDAKRWVHRSDAYRDPNWDFTERGLTIVDLALHAVGGARTPLRGWLEKCP